MYVEGEIPTMVSGNCGCNYGGNYGGFGMGEWGGLIGLIVAASIFNGNGIFGGGNGRGQAATQADLAAGFANNSILSNLNNIILQNSQDTAAIQQTLCRGFSDINLINERGFATTNYNMATNFGQLGSKIDMCCCDLKTMNLENRYLNERQTCDLITNQNANTQRIIDYLACKENQNLRDENFALKLQASQAKQNAYLLSEINPPARPAYTVPNPNCCYNSCGCSGNGFGFNGYSVQ